MFYLSGFLLIIAIALGYSGFRSNSEEIIGGGIALFFASIGTGIISFLALGVLS
ncbi:MAG: hypothetical protein Q8P30_00070 [Candidatus Uhrbacteria bacterium]|nr:hypothetical protein [Candidatus Uhrbacteria bacterium]